MSEIPTELDVDLGHDHRLTGYTWQPDRRHKWARDLPGDPAEVVGAIDHHLKPDGTPCGGSITFATPRGVALAQRSSGRATWEVKSWEPLHVEPSLLCNTCGDHGFIRDGRWVPA